MQEKMVKILLADDDVTVRSMVGAVLEMFGYAVTAVADGRDVIELVDDSYGVIILDVNMQDMGGFDTIKVLNERGLEIPVLFLTGAGSMEYVVQALNLGGYDFITKPIDDLDIFHAKIRRAVEKRNFVLRERDYTNSLENEVREKTKELEKNNQLLMTYSHSLENATIQLMSSLQNAMEEKDFYTAGHTVRVTEYALMLGLAMQLPEKDLVVLRRAAQFHDIGKLVIDLMCIQKPGKLSRDEWELIRKHPGVGANIIRPLGFMEREQFIIRHHHERMDGWGYPDGLKGDELDLLTKILIVVDSYDAMTSSRNYRRNLNMDEAIQELRTHAGTQFDPEIVDTFTHSVPNFVLSFSASV